MASARASPADSTAAVSAIEQPDNTASRCAAARRMSSSSAPSGMSITSLVTVPFDRTRIAVAVVAVSDTIWTERTTAAAAAGGAGAGGLVGSTELLRQLQQQLGEVRREVARLAEAQARVEAQQAAWQRDTAAQLESIVEMQRRLLARVEPGVASPAWSREAL